ncbi:MAG: hypothetical protein ACI9DC_001664, partial [Gammaproteobacteria bacterium]
SGRSHANHEPIDVQTQGAMNVLSDDHRDAIARACATLSKQASDNSRARAATAALTDSVADILEHDE